MRSVLVLFINWTTQHLADLIGFHIVSEHTYGIERVEINRESLDFPLLLVGIILRNRVVRNTVLVGVSELLNVFCTFTEVNLFEDLRIKETDRCQPRRKVLNVSLLFVLNVAHTCPG